MRSKALPPEWPLDLKDGNGSPGLKGDEIGQNISIKNNLLINIVAEDEQEKACAQLERQFMAGDIKGQSISNELIGEFYYTEKEIPVRYFLFTFVS
jgi:hypothetical protein